MTQAMQATWQQAYQQALDKLNAARKAYGQNPNPQAVAALTNAQNEFNRTVGTLTHERLKELETTKGLTERQALAQLAGTLLVNAENNAGENQALAQMILAQAHAPGNESDPLMQTAAQQAQAYMDRVTLATQPTNQAANVPPTGVAPTAPPGAPAVTGKGGGKVSKSQHGAVVSDENVSVDEPPPWEPLSGNMVPGQLPNSPSLDAARDAALTAVRPAYAATGTYMPAGNLYSRTAMNNNAMVFTGYKTTGRVSSRMDEDNPFGSRQYTNLKQASYQSVDALKNALGRTDLGFPDIKAFQTAMGLPVTGVIDDNTQKTWMGIVQGAANNTSAGLNTTWQQAYNGIASWIAAQKRAAAAAQAAMYKVDETTSAAIVGGATKEMLGRLSTGDEDAQFHAAFSRAYAQSQGRVDAQQFARDWIREKHPTEAGTQLGQDYYGAMYDVLTSGPGSLGSEAANVNG